MQNFILHTESQYYCLESDKETLDRILSTHKLYSQLVKSIPLASAQKKPQQTTLPFAPPPPPTDPKPNLDDPDLYQPSPCHSCGSRIFKCGRKKDYYYCIPCNNRINPRN